MPRGIRRWYEQTKGAYERDRSYGLAHGAYYAYVGLWLTATTRYPVGTHVFDREWDLLVVLDTCRTDALRAVADEYDFIGPVDSMVSVGSRSTEWLAHTFSEPYREEIARTAYVTAKYDSETVFRDGQTPPLSGSPPLSWPAWETVDADAFETLAEVWRDGHSDRLSVTPPAAVTDRAIRTLDEADAGRGIVHYMQPHQPYIAEVLDTEEPTPPELLHPFEHLRDGNLSRDRAWTAYLDNLRLVLDEVERLLAAADADRAVITADHGEAFGECGFYQHPLGCPHPVVKTVPWAPVTVPGSHESLATSESVATEP